MSQSAGKRGITITHREVSMLAVKEETETQKKGELEVVGNALLNVSHQC